MTDRQDNAPAHTPHIHGDTATFVWHGETAPALIGDFTDWEDGTPLALEQVEAGVWAHTTTLPRGAYLEYSFWRDGERVADPLNPRTTPDGLGHHNHYFYMPDGGPTPLARRRSVVHGEVTRHVVEDGFMLAGKRRRVDLYHPPAGGPHPLLVVFDGNDFQRRGKLVNLVDNLIAGGRIRPVAMAMVHNGGPARGVEYACSEMTLGLLVAHVLPLAKQHLDLLDAALKPRPDAVMRRGPHAVMGASMGGLMSLYTGLRLPSIFGHVLSLSGAFTLGDYDLVVWDLVRHLPVQPLRVWLGVGRYEWLLEPNRRMRTLMITRGYKPAYHEFNAGHNYPAWRDHLWRGLEHLFPPAWPGS